MWDIDASPRNSSHLSIWGSGRLLGHTHWYSATGPGPVLRKSVTTGGPGVTICCLGGIKLGPATCKTSILPPALPARPWQVSLHTWSTCSFRLGCLYISPLEIWKGRVYFRSDAGGTELLVLWNNTSDSNMETNLSYLAGNIYRILFFSCSCLQHTAAYFKL